MLVTPGLINRFSSFVEISDNAKEKLISNIEVLDTDSFMYPSIVDRVDLIMEYHNNFISAIFNQPLNNISYLPIIGNISGAIRATYGVLKTAFGVGAVALGILGCWSKLGRNLGSTGLDMIESGLSHTGRGIVDIIPLSSMFTKSYDSNRLKASENSYYGLLDSTDESYGIKITYYNWNSHVS